MPDRNVIAAFERDHASPRQPFLPSVEALATALDAAVEDFDACFPEPRKEQIFREAHEGATLLSFLPEAQARDFYRRGCGFLHWSLQRRIWDSLIPLGMARAIRDDDMATLQDAQHSWNRLKLCDAMMVSNGTDHRCSGLAVINAMADGDLDLVRIYLPESRGLPPFKGGYSYGVALVSLLMANLYRREDWREIALGRAQKFLGLKGGTRYEKATLRYLHQLTEGNMATASEALQEVADGYLRMKDLLRYQYNDFHVHWSVYLHGLYNIATLCVDEQQFGSLQRPRHPAFWHEYQDHVQATGRQPGRMLIPMEGRLTRLICCYPERTRWTMPA